MTKTSGFTLLELIVAVVIVGILTTLAIPAFNNIIESSRLTSTVNSLVGAYNLARSEAVDAGVPVIVESDGAGGYRLKNTSTNEVLRTIPAPTGSITVTGFTPVTYQATGYRTFGGAEITIEVCNDIPDCRSIVIKTGGGASVE